MKFIRVIWWVLFLVLVVYPAVTIANEFAVAVGLVVIGGAP